jgi:hypothetical protein
MCFIDFLSFFLFVLLGFFFRIKKRLHFVLVVVFDHDDDDDDHDGDVDDSLASAFQRTAEEWRNVFYVCAAMAVFGALAYSFLSDGELQPWAVPPEAHMELQVDVTRNDVTDDDTPRSVDADNKGKLGKYLK